MKKNSTFFWIMPILVILLAACTPTKAEGVDESSAGLHNLQNDSEKANKKYAKEVAVYRTSVESGLRGYKLKIAKFQDQKTESKEEVLVIRNEKITAMRRSNDELELRMRQYRADNSERWEEFKREFDSDMSVLGKSLRDMEKENAE